MGVISNPKMAFIFSITCILALIFPIFIKYFSTCEGKGSFLKSQIKSLECELSQPYNLAQFELNIGRVWGNIAQATIQNYIGSMGEDVKL